MAYAKPREKLMQIALTRKRKLGNNTYLEILDPMNGPFGDLAIRFHKTNILTYCSDGRIVIDVGGFTTPTTKSRLNEWLPSGWSIVQRSFAWFLSYRVDHDQDLLFPFHNPMTIYPGGKVMCGPSYWDAKETEVYPSNRAR